jgi:23S rRNA (guanine2445-N2)-methyltransferase / 23S rRNA (guanine2069-N7)-methyltransferase
MPSGTGSSKLDLLAATTFGLEAVAARELEDLGYRAKPVGVGRVHFEGDHRAIVDANLWLRSADRVLVRVGEFPVGGGDPGFDQLFEGVRALAWEDWIAPGAAFPVAGRSVRSSITSEPAIQRATKRAIVERLRRAWGSRPAEILPENGPPVRVEVSILRDVATLTIDASGVGLHKRGYREGSPGEAALRETLAAGLVLLGVWRPGRPLVDPFCGSGTIAIEAAMIGRNLAPGLARGFDCERWIDDRGGRLLDPELWVDAREDARSAARPERLKPVVHASDIDDAALALARRNARAAGVELDIHFSKRDFAELSSSLEYGVVITNPPYGVRLGDEADVERLHRSMPAVFRRLPTWSFHILTGRLDTEELFGQRATRRRKLYNATIETTYFSFLGPKAGKELEGLRELGGDSEGESDADERGEAFDEGGALSENDAPPDQGPPLFPAPSPQSSPSPPSSFLAPVFGGLRERDEKEAGEFARALANNLRHLRKYPARGITCYRVYERDVPDVPLIVDRYDDRFHAVEYEREHSRTPGQQADWFELMRSTIAKTAGVALGHVYMKEKHRQRGLTQHEKVGAERATQVVSEGDPALRFEVNLSDYVDTGLFLDHRLTRQMVRERSRGKRLLNLFCYTGSFTVYAAAGGAASSVSVDLSNTYLEWANRNMALNMLGRAEHRFVRSGVLEFLDAHAPAGPQGAYDLMVIDPPTFSNSASTERDWDVQTSHVELLTKAARLLSPDGLVYFSTNFRRFKLDEGALASAGLSARDISAQTIPPEYRNRRIHACWIIRRSGIN